MTIATFFDAVETGISSAETFLGKILTPVEQLFGHTSLAEGVGKLFTELQQACKDVEIVVGGARQSLVMTETVYSSIMSSLGELVKLSKLHPANAGKSRAQLISVLVKDVFETGVPIALMVVAPGSAPVVKLAEETLGKLIPMML
jgi:hypothetical protein